MVIMYVSIGMIAFIVSIAGLCFVPAIDVSLKYSIAWVIAIAAIFIAARFKQ